MPEPSKAVIDQQNQGIEGEQGSKPSLAAELRTNLPPEGSVEPGQGDAGGGDAKPTPTEGKILVNWDEGVTREVDVNELVKFAREHESIMEKSRVADGKFEQASQYEALGKMIQGMTPEQQKELAVLLQDPSRLVQRQPEGQAESQDELETMLNGESKQGDSTNEIAQLRQELAASNQRQERIMTYLNGKEAVSQRESLSDTVDTSMKGFPVYNESAEGAEFAKEAMMTSLAQNPEQDVDALVAQHAAKLHKIYQGRMKAAAPTPTPGASSEEQDFTLPDSKPFSGEDLMHGKVGRSLSEQLRDRL